MRVETEQVVYVVEDDENVRQSLADLLGSIGLAVEAFASADSFLQAFNPARQVCLVTDLMMPGMSGIALQANLIEQGIKIPIIFISGYGDIPVVVQAIKAGAADFLEKPIRSQVFLDAVQKALEQDKERYKTKHNSREIQGLMARLTEREREVLAMIMDGHSNKEMARQLGVSPKTIEAHRANLYSKMRADSLAALVRKGIAAAEE
jgi:two-component system, LuxR family, response regulator FixJ